MSRPPGIIDRVNYVVESWNNPCDTPWAVYVETALPAALDALIAVVCFDIFDVARFIFRPANLRGGKHGSRKRKGQHGRKPKGIAAKLASKLPPFSRLRNRKVSQGVANLWIIDGIGQRLLWWWLVADVVSGFAYNWTSMIYKTERCQMALAPGAAVREHTTQGFLGIQPWPDVIYTVLQYQKGNVQTLPAAFDCGDGKYRIVASLEVTNNGALPNTVELRVHLVTPGGIRDFPGGAISLQPGSSGGLVASASQKGPFDGWIEVQVSVGSVSSDGGALYIQGEPPKQEPPVKFTCDIPFFN